MNKYSLQIPRYDIKQYEQEIENLLEYLYRIRLFEERINIASGHFLGRPFLWGAAGEGPQGLFNQLPIFRTDKFDCVTYVNTVMAILYSRNIEEFKKRIIQINYRSELVSYENRHHFLSVDWNKYNGAHGFIKDVTTEIYSQNTGPSFPHGSAVAGQRDFVKPVYQIAEADIDKPNWFRKRDFQDIHLLENHNQKDLELLLEKMHLLAEQMKIERSQLPYLPLKLFINEDKTVNNEIINQLPAVSIIEIVRPDWNLVDKIGTYLDVSHLGFLLKNSEGQLILRHATWTHQRVTDMLLSEYLLDQSENPTIKGINIQKLQPIRFISPLVGD